MEAKDIKRILEYELGDWNDSACISEDGKTVTIQVENWDRPSSDEPYAYRFEFDLEGDFLATGVGGCGRNWGTPYDGAGLDTLEKVRYACECAKEHNWRHWGGN